MHAKSAAAPSAPSVLDGPACRQWLAAQDPADPRLLPSLEALLASIGESVRSPDLRLEIAEQARPVHLRALDRLAASLRACPFPMPQGQRRVAARLLAGLQLGREVFERLHAELREHTDAEVRTIIPGTTLSLRAILPLIRALDYQSRLIVAQQQARLRVGHQDWDRLCLLAADVRASTFQDVVLPDLAAFGRAPTARALFIYPLLMALISPGARSEPELALAARLARRWAPRVGFLIAPGSRVTPCVSGPVLGLGPRQTVRLDSHQLLPRLAIQRDQVDRLTPGARIRLPRGLSLGATRELLALLAERWSPGYVALSLPDAPLGRLRAGLGFPGPGLPMRGDDRRAGPSTALRDWALAGERVDWVAQEHGQWFIEREFAAPLSLGDLLTLAVVTGDARGRAAGRDAGNPAVRLARVVSLSQRLGDDLALPPVQRVGLSVWPGEPRPLLIRNEGAGLPVDAVLLSADPVSREPESLILPARADAQRGARLHLGEAGRDGRVELVASVLGSPVFRQWLFRRLPD
ncbi:MAG: hypothetical protein KGQ67_07660 [Betaproteobacteria bacterium]|nr:hypothetical protein [Betaproteobacteria bacterium]